MPLPSVLRACTQLVCFHACTVTWARPGSCKPPPPARLGLPSPLAARTGLQQLEHLATKQLLLVSWRYRQWQPNSYALPGLSLASSSLDPTCEAGWKEKETKHAKHELE